jgi:DNA polymerase-3 subunit chi
MTEVLFYHLTESTLEDALPGLLERSLERGWRAVVQVASEERRDALDARLWTYSEEGFLAHGTDAEDHAAHQPVLLTVGTANPNGAHVRFFVDGAVPGDVGAYVRAVVMFDGHDQQQLEAARHHWKALKAEGHDASYWQQTPDRRWQKKA